jgi:hypothetical protein
MEAGFQPHAWLRTVLSAVDDLDKQLMEDMARLQEREKPFVSGGSSSSNASMPPSSSSAATDPASPLEGIKEAVDKLLIADFFFILFALAWLAAGLAAKSALNFTVSLLLVFQLQPPGYAGNVFLIIIMGPFNTNTRAGFVGDVAQSMAMGFSACHRRAHAWGGE